MAQTGVSISAASHMDEVTSKNQWLYICSWIYMCGCIYAQLKATNRIFH